MENRAIGNWIEANRSKVDYSKSKIKASKKGQSHLGDIIEKNFITAAMAVSNQDHVTITRTSSDIDYIFGADIKIQYRVADMDGFSVYADITTNPYKKYCILHQENVYTMSNGCKVSIGYKKENSVFYYRKPVLVIMLHNEWQEITFEESDVAAILFICAQLTKWLSETHVYKYGERFVTGGKRATTKVIKKDTLPERSEGKQLVIN